MRRRVRCTRKRRLQVKRCAQQSKQKRPLSFYFVIVQQLLLSEVNRTYWRNCQKEREKKQVYWLNAFDSLQAPHQPVLIGSSIGWQWPSEAIQGAIDFNVLPLFKGKTKTKTLEGKVLMVVSGQWHYSWLLIAVKCRNGSE